MELILHQPVLTCVRVCAVARVCERIRKGVHASVWAAQPPPPPRNGLVCSEPFPILSRVRTVARWRLCGMLWACLQPFVVTALRAGEGLGALPGVIFKFQEAFTEVSSRQLKISAHSLHGCLCAPHQEHSARSCLCAGPSSHAVALNLERHAGANYSGHGHA